MENIAEVSPPVLVTLLLNAVGFIISKTGLSTNYIPIILPIVGGIAYPLVAKMEISNLNSIALNTVYGVIFGASAVGFNQLVKKVNTVTNGVESTKEKTPPCAEEPKI